MMDETHKARCQLAMARCKQLLERLSEHTGVQYQVYCDAEGNNLFNFYTDDSDRVPSLGEVMDAMRDYVSRIEAKGQLRKAEQLEMANNFKRLLTKYRGE